MRSIRKWFIDAWNTVANVEIAPLRITPEDFGMAKTANIVKQANGRFAIMTDGQIVETYARSRDARRGARRRGLNLA